MRVIKIFNSVSIWSMGLCLIFSTFVVADKAGATIQYGSNSLVSSTSQGDNANGSSFVSSVSSDGRYVAFSSSATNLANGDSSNTPDVYVKDTLSGAVTRASVSSGGVGANAQSQNPSISADGRFVAFASNATNLVANDTNPYTDVYVRDMVAGTTELVSVAYTGNAGNSNSFRPEISADGRFVIFQSSAWISLSYTSGGSHIFVRDRLNATTQLVDRNAVSVQAGADSEYPSISCDGNWIAFSSKGSNLTPNDTNNKKDVFITSRTNPSQILIVTPGGNGDSGEPRISCDGNTVALTSDASNLGFADTNNTSDVFRFNKATNELVLISRSLSDANATANAQSRSPAISTNGQYVAYASKATNLEDSDLLPGNDDVYVRDLLENKNIRLSVFPPSITGVDGSSDQPDISSNGAYVTYNSNDNHPVAINGVNGRADIFVHNLVNFNDQAPPIVTGSLSVEANTHGWHNSNVDINWQSIDPTPSSGPSTQPPVVTASIEAANVTYSSSMSCDPVGNCATGSVELSIDKTSPNITADLLPATNSQGWYNQDVLVKFVCSDSLSGIDVCTDPVVISSEGQGQQTTGSALDRAGNSSQRTAEVSLDKTMPTITANVSQQQNANGWNNGSVDIIFNCEDLLSGVESCSQPVTLDHDGANQVVIGTAIDKAGNEATVMVVISIDATGPSIAATLNPAPNSNGWSNQAVTVNFTCMDGLSGVDFCSSPITLNQEGQNQFVTGTVIDKAGNLSSATAQVNIDFTKPVVGSVNLSRTFMLLFQPITITANVSDSLSNIDTTQSGEYYIDSDPGVGNAIPMTLSNGNLTAVITNNPGSLSQHTVYVRTKDKAGNWSVSKSATFTIIL